jgi:2-keto-4-pentenoate hydratase/2-oxohepta-3-ene-1,7-dioic acid hydratase in catechol pathway
VKLCAFVPSPGAPPRLGVVLDDAVVDLSRTAPDLPGEACALLAAGDVVRVEIEGLGALENPIVSEPADTARI